jgi:hypothetical protein
MLYFFHGNSGKNEIYLPFVHFHACLCIVQITGHLKGAEFEPLVEQPKPTFFPNENLNPVSSAIEEDEVMSTQWILPEDLSGDTEQSIVTLPHVDWIPG